MYNDYYFDRLGIQKQKAVAQRFQVSESIRKRKHCASSRDSMQRRRLSDSPAENPGRPFDLNPQTRANTSAPGPSFTSGVAPFYSLVSTEYPCSRFSFRGEPRPLVLGAGTHEAEKELYPQNDAGYFTSERTNSGDDGKSSTPLYASWLKDQHRYKWHQVVNK